MDLLNLVDMIYLVNLLIMVILVNLMNRVVLLNMVDEGMMGEKYLLPNTLLTILLKNFMTLR